MSMSPKMDEKELLELFGAFVHEHEKDEKPKVDELKSRVREKLGNFPARFASGALELLKSLETTITK